MELPNAEVTIARKPAWLETQDQQNEILRKSANPEGLRAHYDCLLETAQSSYDAAFTRFEAKPLQDELKKIAPELVKPLVELFELSYRDEMKSTHRTGGSLAGSRCSQMRCFSEILAGLRGLENA